MLLRSSLLAGLFVLSASAEWRDTGPWGGAAEVIRVSPQNPDVAIAATRNGLVYLSENGGTLWTPLAFPGELAGILHALEIDPRAGGAWYAGMEGENAWNSGLYKTTDAGHSWTLLAGLKGKAIWSLAIWPANPDVIAAGGGDGVYLSRDAGESWSRISPESNSELRPVVSLAFHPTDSNVLYAGTTHLPWRTTNGGATWESIHAGMHDDSDVFSIRVDPRNPERVFASACSGVYKSTNGGVLWTRLPTPLGAFRTYLVSLDPRNAGIIFAGTSAGLVRSTDDGATWARISAHAVKSIAFDPLHDGRILFASASGGVLLSTNGGRTVQESNLGFSNRSFTTLAGAGGVLYAASVYEAGTVGLWRSDDPGLTWRPLAGQGIHGNILILAASPDHSDTVFAAGYSSLWKSSDGGRKWFQIDAPRAAGRITALLPLPSGALLAGTESGLYRASSSGIWRPVLLGGGPSRVEFVQRSGERAIAVITSAGAYVGEDTEGAWTACGPLPERAAWYGLAVDPTADGTALAATSRGLFRSTDRCASWTPVREGLDGGTVSHILFHPTEHGVVFASQYGGLVQSTDSGVHWQPVDVGGRHRFWPSALLIVSAAPERLFALLPRRGVLSCSIGPDVASAHGSSGR
ncbi:MAG: YCF48-related protein [Bryobacteraceae bacterium]